MLGKLFHEHPISVKLRMECVCLMLIYSPRDHSSVFTAFPALDSAAHIFLEAALISVSKSPGPTASLFDAILCRVEVFVTLVINTAPRHPQLRGFPV